MSNPDKKKRSKSKRKTRRIIKQIILLIFLAVFLGLGYYYINYYEKHSSHTLYENDGDYVEVEASDSLDYLAVVVYKNDANINTIANTFYKNSIFWPYIFIENKDVINNPLNIDANVIIKIPKLSPTLLDLKNTASIKRVQFLGDSILESVSKKNLELEE